MAESEEELKSLLMKVKVESEKLALSSNSENEDHGIWSHHFMGNRWGNSGRLCFGGAPKSLQMVTAAKRRLLLRRKVMTNLDSIFKSRDITLPTKVRQSRLWFFQWSCMDVRVGL